MAKTTVKANKTVTKTSVKAAQAVKRAVIAATKFVKVAAKAIIAAAKAIIRRRRLGSCSDHRYRCDSRVCSRLGICHIYPDR